MVKIMRLYNSFKINDNHKNSIILIAPSDHLIPNVDDFHNAILKGLPKLFGGNIITFGIKPTRVETGYGYLELSNPTKTSVEKLKCFIEKPNKSIAKKMVASGSFLWNSGIYMFRAKDMISLFEKHAPKLTKLVKKSPSIGNKTITIKNDPRILPFGRYLRKTKINELPQLLNILFGNLSIVGPRPLTLEIFLLYPEKTQFLITQIKPGLSGIGSIVFRNEENILNQSSDNLEIYKKNIIPYKGELEIWFTQNNTLINYFKIIFLTIVVVLFPKNKSIWRLFKNLPSPPLKLKKLL